jgi:superfamily II DNA/RNA helicase
MAKRKGTAGKMEFPLYDLAIKDGVFDLESGFLICGPTASGKSKIGRDVIIKQLELGRPDILIVYLVPYKALAEEVYSALKSDLVNAIKAGRIEPVELAIATSDYDRPFNLKVINVLVGTYERAIGLLNKTTDTWPEVIIADEFHIVSDGSRGPQIEALMAHLASSKNVRIYALSAVLREPDRIAEWLRLKTVIGGDDERPTSLTIKFKITTNKGAATRSITRSNVEKGNLLIFCSTKSNTVKTADMLKEIVYMRMEDKEKKLAEEFATKVQQEFPYLIDLPKLLEKGVAYHNADLEVEVRNLIVSAFNNGIIKVICATPTLAAGVNIAARVVILHDIERYNAAVRRKRVIPVAEALNMLGRAGRPNLSEEGFGYVLVTKKQKKTRWCDQFISSIKTKTPDPLRSRIPDSDSNIQLFVLSAVARFGDSFPKEILKEYNSTLWAYDGTTVEELPSCCEDVVNDVITSAKRDWSVKFLSKSLEIDKDTIIATGGSRDYDITLSPDSASCTCLGWTYSKKCKHVQELQLGLISGEIKIKGKKGQEIALSSLKATLLLGRPDFWLLHGIEKLVDDGFIIEEEGVLKITEDGRRALVSYHLSLDHITLLKKRLENREPKNTDEVIDWAMKDFSSDPSEKFPKTIVKPFKRYLAGVYYRDVFDQYQMKPFLDARGKLDQIFLTYHALLESKEGPTARMIRDARRRVHYGCTEELLPIMVLDRPQIKKVEYASKMKSAGLTTISDMAAYTIDEYIALLDFERQTATILSQSLIGLEGLLADFRYDSEIPGEYSSAIDLLSVRTSISVDNLRDYVFDMM